MNPQNRPIADAFVEIADLLELQRADPVRIRAYRKASQAVASLANSVRSMIRQGSDLRDIPAIGETLANTAIEIAETGSCTVLQRLHAEIPQDFSELLQLPHLGPQRVRTLHEELGVSTLKQLHIAAREGRLQSLAGFGPRLEQQILKATTASLTRVRRLRLDAALPAAERMRAWLQGVDGVERVEFSGDLRRACESVAHVDLIAQSLADREVVAALANHADVREVPFAGRARVGVVLGGGLQVNLHVAPAQEFAAAWLASTGCHSHIGSLASRALKHRLTLDEHGLKSGGKPFPDLDETSLYNHLGLGFIPPELREDRGEIEAAEAGMLPLLVERTDLRGDLQVQTRDGSAQTPLEQLVQGARAQGLSYIAVADHARRINLTRTNDLERLAQQMVEIDRLNGQMDDFVILKGVHVDILEDGSLNVPDSVLRGADLVVGTISYQFDLTRARQTQRLLRAMDNRFFSILAAPTGRLIEERRSAAMDLARVLQKARERGCFVELNCLPARLDLDEEGCRAAKAAGVLVSIDSAARTAAGFANLRHGVGVARRAWLEKADVLNTRPIEELRALLRHTMAG